MDHFCMNRAALGLFTALSAIMWGLPTEFHRPVFAVLLFLITMIMMRMRRGGMSGRCCGDKLC